MDKKAPPSRERLSGNRLHLCILQVAFNQNTALPGMPEGIAMVMVMQARAAFLIHNGQSLPR